jgi:predicted ATPase/class 3 adenylate cyclase
VGIVSFLFTDIEGSTKLWQAYPDAMSEVIKRHDKLLCSTVQAHGGTVFQTAGDAVLAAFADPVGAVRAALDGQRALEREPWHDGIDLRVRMAVHTGPVEVREGNYLGHALNRVARLLSAGHGGQILLSQDTQELVNQVLPPGVELRDMGRHRLKDLLQPEHIFCLLLPDHDGDLPPLRSLGRAATALPVQPTTFVGRKLEVESVRDLMRNPDVRLVTLTGPGGCGKTRIALEVAAALSDDFEQGVLFVPLAGLADSSLVAPTLAMALDAQDADLPREQGVVSALGDQHKLLILDNFEHVTEASPLVARILSACPCVKILATSRAVLRLSGEQEFLVPPMALPDPDRLPEMRLLGRYEAVELFVLRAQAVKPGFTLTAANAESVVRICLHLDGLPLAIELAAARTRLFSPDALLPRLASRLKLLTGGARDVPVRQQTLRGTIDWSYGLLETREKELFGSLAVFVGGCTLEAAEAVCADPDDGDILDALSSLVEKSLVRQEESSATGREPRFLMLETIREYALERLTESPRDVEIRRLHATFHRELAVEAEGELSGSNQAYWLQCLEVEHDNLRAALQWYLNREEFEDGLRLGTALFQFWYVHGHFREGQEWLDALLASAAGMTSPLRVSALRCAGVLTELLGNYAAAESRYRESLRLAIEAEDVRGRALALNDLGVLAREQRHGAEARVLLEEALSLRRELDDPAMFSRTLSNLGIVTLDAEEFDRAAALLQESLELARGLNDASGIAIGILNLGGLALRRGDHDRALPLFLESLKHLVELGDRGTVPDCLEGLASVAVAQGEGERAVRLMGAAGMLRERVGCPMPNEEQARYDEVVARSKMLLAEHVWNAAWEHGRALTLEQAVNYAALGSTI